MSEGTEIWLPQETLLEMKERGRFIITSMVSLRPLPRWDKFVAKPSAESSRVLVPAKEIPPTSVT